MLNFNQLCRANRLFGRGCCLQSPCAWWADVPVNINADQAVLPTLSTHRNELWDCGPGCLQKGVVIVQSLCRVRLFVTPWTAACQASLSFTVSWSLLKFMSIELVMLSNQLILCCPFPICLQFFPASGFLSTSLLFISDCQSIGTSASVSVLPMNIQDWFPLGLTGLISLLSKGP